MNKRLETKHVLIEPIYTQAEPNEPIGLGTTAIEFSHKGKTYRCNASVKMRFTPGNRLSFIIPVADSQPLLGLSLSSSDKWDGKLKLTERGVSLDMVYVGSGGEIEGLSLIPKVRVVTVTPASKDLTKATFHLFNFPDFYGPDDYSLTRDEPPRQGWTRCGRVILKADGWSITIAATDKTDELCKAIHRQGGFVITHMGRAEREDGSTFTSDQLNDLLQCLHYFLSFALGRWAGLALPIGFDKLRKKAFEQWGLPMTAPGRWGGSCSWFDSQHGELLAQVFPGFVALWKNELWHRTLSEGLYWYLGACERGTGIGVDTGLILAQTALERLAWTYCVQNKKMVSPDAFELRGRLSAANKLRMLASSLDIPLDIPAGLSALHAQRGEKWRDGMDAITGIRNAIVHPRTKKRKEFPDGSYYEGWALSLWYIDLVLLRLCGHSGEYANRLRQKRWVGEVEQVPWAKTATTNDTDH